jgi:hypothetical protein
MVPTPGLLHVLDQCERNAMARITDLKCVNSRYRTFYAKDWPLQMAQSAKDMAEAGFYYTGTGDKVQCPFCDLTLHSWLESENPLENHIGWAKQQDKKCIFLQLSYPKKWKREDICAETN